MSREAGPVELLVLQSTPFCNLDCGYCYLPDRLDRSKMSLATVGRAAEFVRRIGLGPRLDVVWHSGEPLVIEPSWYRAAHRLLSDALGGALLRFHFQSNGTMLSPAWLDFLGSEPRTRISISLDGPSDIHDSARRTRSGRGTHDRVMHAVECLRDAAIPFDCIAVVSPRTLGAPEAFYRFFEGVRPECLGLNPEEVEGVNRTSALGEDQLERYERFLFELFQLWDNARPFAIREIDRLERYVQWLRTAAESSPSRRVDNPEVSPWRVVSVDARGGVQTFSPELLGMELGGLGTNLGNLHVEPFESLIASTTVGELRRRIDAGVERCRKGCDYYELCGGGAPSNKFFEQGSFEGSETNYCRMTVQAPVRAYLRARELSAPLGGGGPAFPEHGGIRSATP